MIWPYYVFVVTIFMVKNKYYSTCCTNRNANLHQMMIMIVVLVHNDMCKIYPLVYVCVFPLSCVQSGIYLVKSRETWTST